MPLTENVITLDPSLIRINEKLDFDRGILECGLEHSKGKEQKIKAGRTNSRMTGLGKDKNCIALV